jgi:hypothetical protein
MVKATNFPGHLKGKDFPHIFNFTAWLPAALYSGSVKGPAKDELMNQTGPSPTYNPYSSKERCEWSK